MTARWKDDAVVTIASNIHGVYPISAAQRYSTAQQSEVGVPRPNTVTKYNSFMSGADQIDSNINVYRGKNSGGPYLPT